MKKIWHHFAFLQKKSAFFLLLMLFLLLVWCGTKKDAASLLAYNNDLLSYQENIVQELKNYYQNLENIRSGEDLKTRYMTSVDTFQNYYHIVMSKETYYGDSLLRDAIWSYLSGVILAFERYEAPIIDRMLAFSGDHADFYRESKVLVSQNTLAFSMEIARLDKVLEMEYWAFLEQYSSLLKKDQLSSVWEE